MSEATGPDRAYCLDCKRYINAVPRGSDFVGGVGLDVPGPVDVFVPIRNPRFQKYYCPKCGRHVVTEERIEQMDKDTRQSNFMMRWGTVALVVSLPWGWATENWVPTVLAGILFFGAFCAWWVYGDSDAFAFRKYLGHESMRGLMRLFQGLGILGSVSMGFNHSPLWPGILVCGSLLTGGWILKSIVLSRPVTERNDGQRHSPLHHKWPLLLIKAFPLRCAYSALLYVLGYAVDYVLS